MLAILCVSMKSEMIVFLDNAAWIGFRYLIHELVDLMHIVGEWCFNRPITVVIFPIAIRAIMMITYRVPILLGCFFFRCTAIIPCTIIIAVNQCFPTTIACNAV